MEREDSWRMFIELNLPLVCVSSLKATPLPYFLIATTFVDYIRPT